MSKSGLKRYTARKAIRCHEFRVEFNWVITEFGYSDGLQALATLWQVGIAFYPTETVHVYAASALVFIFGVFGKARLQKHIDVMSLCASAQERKIEEVAVKRSHDSGLNLLDVLKEAIDCGRLEKQ